MPDYIRALHPSPEQEGMSEEIPNEQLPGCGKAVLIEYRDAPPVQEGDIFRDECPSCQRHNSRLEVLEVCEDE